MTILKDRYELHQKLGEGGMAIVYRATQINLERTVAVKFIRQQLTTDETFKARFEREAKAIARLNHPNIMQVYDFDQADDGRYFMVMELLRGKDLATYINRLALGNKKFPLAEAVRIVREVAKGLHHAHQHNMIHRDVKPQNIFLTKDNRVVIMDFGIIKLVGSGNITASGMVVGTPHYFAPEQGTDGDIDHRVDVYALGVVFYEMITGQLPFDDPSTVAVIAKHINAPIPDPCEIRPELPPACTALIRRVLAKDRDERIPDMLTFIAELETVLESKAGRDDEGTILLDSTPRASITKPTRSSETSNQTVWQLLLALLVLIVLVVGAVLISRDNASNGDAADSVGFDVNIDPAAEDEILVLVTDFAGDEEAGVDVTRRVANTLRNGDVALTLGERYRLEQVDETVASIAEADALAAETGALLVVWGIQDAAGLEVVVQAHGYPDGWLHELRYIVPPGDNFATVLNEDLPVVIAVYAQWLTAPRLLLEDDYMTLDRIASRWMQRPDVTDLRGIPASTLDHSVLEATRALVRFDFEAADRAAADIMALQSDDVFIRWWRFQINLALRDTEAMASYMAFLNDYLPQESVIRLSLPLNLAAVTNDFATILDVTGQIDPALVEAYPDVVTLRVGAFIALGQFQEALDTLDNQVPHITTESARVPAWALEASIHAMRADEDAVEVIREAIETVQVSSVSMPTALDYMYGFTTLAANGYYLELIGDRAGAREIYEHALSLYPDDYWFNWRLGAMSEDAQMAYSYYRRALANAPAPFPLVQYEIALLVGDIEGGVAGCDELGRAQTEANGAPNFYVGLLEEIGRAERILGCHAE